MGKRKLIIFLLWIFSSIGTANLDEELSNKTQALFPRTDNTLNGRHLRINVVSI